MVIWLCYYIKHIDHQCLLKLYCILGNCRWSLSGHTAPVSSLKLDPTGALCLSTDVECRDRSIRLWDLNKGKSEQVINICVICIWLDLNSRQQRLFTSCYNSIKINEKQDTGLLMQFLLERNPRYNIGLNSDHLKIFALYCCYDYR